MRLPRRVLRHVRPGSDDHARVAELFVDVESTLAEFTLQTVQQIERLAPFGQGNSRPLLCASGVRWPARPSRWARRPPSDTQVCSMGLRFAAWRFNRAEWLPELDGSQETELDVAFRPVINEFRGRRTVELHLEDWRPSRESRAR